jgi:hypothetical protein
MCLEKVCRRRVSPVTLQHSRLQCSAGLRSDPIERKIECAFRIRPVNREIGEGERTRLLSGGKRRENGVNLVCARKLLQHIERSNGAAGARREYPAKRNDYQYS